jgi:hypothetical protein
VDIGFVFAALLVERLCAGVGVRSESPWTNTLGLKRILAITNPDNEASIKLLGKDRHEVGTYDRMSADAPAIKLYAFG